MIIAEAATDGSRLMPEPRVYYGHNGVRDVSKATDAGDFTRVRVGIGRPPGRQDSADFVLKDFSGTEKASLPNLVSDAADAVEAIVEHGLVAAQQRFHSPA